MAHGITEVWTDFRQGVESQARRLAGELAATWNEVRTWSDALDHALRPVEAGEFQAGSLQSLEGLFKETGRRLLFEPIELCQKRKPFQRVLSAIHDCRTSVEDLLRRVPTSAKLSGRELVALVGPARGAGWRKHWLRWQGFTREIPLRGVLWGQLQRQILDRTRLDGAFQLVLAESCLHLLGPWQIYRRQGLRVLSGLAPGPQALDNQWRQWKEADAQQAQRGARLLEGYQKWAETAGAALAGGVLRKPWAPSERASDQIRARNQRCLSYWSRQQRAVQAVLSLELQLARVFLGATQETATSLISLQSEHEELLRELNAVREWLESWSLGQTARPFPPPQARMLSAEQRLGDWLRRVSAQARVWLPTSIEVVEPRRALPGWRTPWRELAPQQVFTGTLESAAHSLVEEGFRQAEQAHRAIIREIERAREVVAFGMETAASEEAGGQGLVEEAVRNALALLLYHEKTVGDVRPLAEAGLVQGQATAFSECYLALEKDRIGLLAHLTRQRGREALHQAQQAAVEGLRTAGQASLRGIRSACQWVLLRIGWLTPPRPRLAPVHTRAHLGQILEMEMGGRELPAIYRRLFRLAPVEDPRFLVGREAELAGLAEAFAQWRAGRSVAVLVVGARGSGKTSLLNCTATSVFQDAKVVRGQFCGRSTSPGHIEGFLRSLWQLPEQADVAASLAADSQVVILEELERTFLRVIDGFGALRALLSLIRTTSASTLWVLSINETAFRYLDAVVSLGQSFSQRINAMSVEQHDLTNAILQRHNLSGLRLEFAPPLEQDPRVSKLRRFLGLEQEAQQLFFDALYRQSEGIFRSAFELWQGCIERVEGGLVYMRQPLAPDYRPLLSELSLEDYFTLQAILQHGSLTEEEVARTLGLTAEDSHRRLERLRLLEVLEPEAACPGLRVRPEAGRVVREGLHRQNLI